MQEMQGTRVWCLGQADPLEKEMATHSSILAWEIPQTEDPGGLQSTVLQRVGHDWAQQQLINSVVIFSGGQQRNSVMRIRVSIAPYHAALQPRIWFLCDFPPFRLLLRKHSSFVSYIFKSVSLGMFLSGFPLPIQQLRNSQHSKAEKV